MPVKSTQSEEVKTKSHHPEISGAAAEFPVVRVPLPATCQQQGHQQGHSKQRGLDKRDKKHFPI